MQYNKLNIEIRPRQPWEGLALGKNLLLNYAKAVYPPWLCLWFTCSVIVYLLPINIHLKFALIIWVAPLLERVIVFVLSRAVFGTVPHWKSSLKNFPSQCKTAWFAALITTRLNPARAFLSPIWQLEGSRGKVASKRYNDLGKDATQPAIWFGFFSALIEGVCIFAVDSLIYTENLLQVVVKFILEQIPIPDSRIISLFFLTIFVYGLLRPFYVSSCFALYLSQRIKVEGWDIELQFRNILKKLKNANLLLFFFLSFSFVIATPSYAEDNPQNDLQEIMAHPDFSESQEIERIVFPKLDWGIDMDLLVNIVLIVVVIALVIGLIVLFYKLFSNAPRIDYNYKAEVKAPLKTLMGIDISGNNLPDDISGEALKLLNAGELRSALSLLYRGSLFHAAVMFRVEFAEGDTEGDCLRKVMAKKATQLSEYFKTLTRVWQYLAYAHSLPDEKEIRHLCQSWDSIFKGVKHD